MGRSCWRGRKSAPRSSRPSRTRAPTVSSSTSSSQPNRAGAGVNGFLVTAAVVLSGAAAAAGGGWQRASEVTSRLSQPPSTSWPTYNGDYSGRRFSPLTTINDANVGGVSLAWVYRANAGGTPGGGAIKSTPLQDRGILYFTVPDHVWAVDARTGREVWHFQWPSSGGNHLANRGVAILGDWLFFETPDCHLVSLNINDGTERWRTPIC